MRALPAAGRVVVAAAGPCSIPVEQEDDIVIARCAARDVCRALGFSAVGQTKVATAVSELARNIFQYAGRGAVEIRPLAGEPPLIEIEASDQGPGIDDVDAVLEGRYRSRTGMGMGLRGVRRLMDSFSLRSSRGRGTVVSARKARE